MSVTRRKRALYAEPAEGVFVPDQIVSHEYISYESKKGGMEPTATIVAKRS
jgi:hypothetical protein